ncbi:hypothetical protein UCRPC4_g03799 [Phaeomoniella chlamydospora]|uniref:Uncharacterized protein n=1 Tax=Phaeomoniella chlamydospora TaxID=158046 RepID=A0A0G2EGK5_PHACM|nr:hypothetical protein UCRPC4_g03799 [Phaeomoniella chlamydospora]
MADDPGDMYEDEEAAIQRQRRGCPSATPSTKPSAIHSDIPSTTPSSAPKPDPPSPSSEPYEPPKETWIIRDHSSVSGRYTLYDLLYIRSITGSISIEIEIPSDWNERSRPSVVDIATSSGSVSINYVDAFGRSIGRTGIFGSNEGDDGSEEIYFSKSSSSSASTRQRTLVSSVSSKTGGISGHFLHGNQTTYKTETGSISGTFYPIGPVSEDSYLSTSTTSGSTSLTITDPLQRRQMSNADRTQVYHLENLYSYHTTYASGSATLKYPGTWSGTVEIKTDGSGSRKASGTGLHIIEETPNRIVASRGHAKGTAVIHQYGSGSVTFTCAGLMDTIRGMWQGGNDKAGKAGDKEFEGVMGWLVWMMEEAIDSLDRVQGDKEMETENLNDLNAGDME